MLRAIPIFICIFAAVSHAQVLDVNVGITPACPYGLSACWGGAEQGLTRLSGVTWVTHKPDAANSLAEVKLVSTSMPDLAKWSDQFHAVVGQVYAFRGVEIAVRGTISRSAAGELQIKVPGIKDAVTLVPMHHKLQWNYRQAIPKAIAPEEAAAFGNLKALFDAQTHDHGGDHTGDHAMIVRITGPLAPPPLAIGHADLPAAIEVRSFVIDDSRSPTTTASPTTKPTTPSVASRR